MFDLTFYETITDICFLVGGEVSESTLKHVNKEQICTLLTVPGSYTRFLVSFSGRLLGNDEHLSPKAFRRQYFHCLLTSESGHNL